MDYEKKYNEALERAKAEAIDGYLDAVALETIFPELKESEDERIRNDIMEAVENWHPYERVEEIRAYLEKQKEQKPVEWSEEEQQTISFAVDWLTKMLERTDVPEAKRDIESVILGLKSLRPRPHWKPSEQEKGALRTAISILTDERNFPKAAAQLQNILDAFEGKESRPAWKPSEEQMKALNDVANEGVLLDLFNDLLKLF